MYTFFFHLPLLKSTWVLLSQPPKNRPFDLPLPSRKAFIFYLAIREEGLEGKMKLTFKVRRISLYTVVYHEPWLLSRIWGSKSLWSRPSRPKPYVTNTRCWPGNIPDLPSSMAKWGATSWCQCLPDRCCQGENLQREGMGGFCTKADILRYVVDALPAHLRKAGLGKKPE